MKVNGKEVDSTGCKTALDVLIKNRIDVSNECRNGVCGACRCKATGSPEKLIDTLGYHAKDEILPCSVSALSDIDITI